MTVDSIHLTVLADAQLRSARDASSGRSARVLHGGSERSLRQVLLAIAAGRGLADHANPGEATVQVLRGRVRLSADTLQWEGGEGDYAIVPPSRHRLDALEDSVVLLTVVASPG